MCLYTLYATNHRESTIMQPINFNYARVAIHDFTTKYMTTRHKLPKVHMPTYAIVSKKVLPITHTFKNKWHPNEAKIEFLSKFSVQAWLTLDSAENKAHTLRTCCACPQLMNQNLVPFRLVQSLVKRSNVQSLAYH